MYTNPIPNGLSRLNKTLLYIYIYILFYIYVKQRRRRRGYKPEKNNAGRQREVRWRE